MVRRGAAFKDVADILGHQRLQTTNIYAKLDPRRWVALVGDIAGSSPSTTRP
jgi:site-specific recombinase XerD